MTLGWVPMMAAMMLPGAAPAIARRARDRDRDRVRAAPLFAGSCVGIWMLAGLAVVAVYRPPGDCPHGRRSTSRSSSRSWPSP